ncbi:hypothetical protein, partial [Falsiroseomonas selenitidurans]
MQKETRAQLCQNRKVPDIFLKPTEDRTLAQLHLTSAQLAAYPHLPAFWPDRAVRAGHPADALPLGAPGMAALRYTPGPFRPPRLAGRAVPVLLVLGPGPDPIGAALAARPPQDPVPVARAMRAVRQGRIGDGAVPG